MNNIEKNPLLPPDLKASCELSPIPFAVYYVKNGRFQAYLVSAGFCKMYESTSEKLLKRLNGDNPFVNIPERDELWKLVKDFSEKDIPLNAIFHEYIGKGNNRKLYTIHAIGTREYTDDGRKYSIVRYNEVSDADRRMLFSAEQLEIKRQREREIAIMDGLSRDYDVVWFLEGKSHAVSLIRSKKGVGVVDSAVKAIKNIGIYDDAIAYHIQNFVIPEDRERMIEGTAFEVLAARVPENRLYSLNYRQDNGHGGIRYLQICYAHAGDNDYVVGIRNIESIIRDELAIQDKLSNALERAEAADKAKSSFLFNVSHDIRTPLNAIIGFTDLAEKYESDREKVLSYRAKVKTASLQLLDILNNVLEMACIENGKIKIENEVNDTRIFHNNWVDMFSADLRKKNLTLTTQFSVTHPYLYMDKTHMTEIFMNVLSNAIKYTADGGHITVTSRELKGRTADEVIVETVIEDNGIGMSTEFCNQVFEEFARERTAQTMKIQGTGLGLAIVKRLVDLMNGTISISSKIGHGTKVTICTPHQIAEEPKYIAKPDNTWDSEKFRGKRILLAEDNELNAEIALEVLKDAGLEVDIVSDGLACINKLKASPTGTYNLILMDIQMPNMNGYKTTQYIRNLPNPDMAQIPIVAMTANAFKEDVDRAFESGMNGHIPKPIDIAKMMSTLGEFLK